MSVLHKTLIILLTLASIALAYRERAVYAQDGSFCDFFLGRYLVREVEPSDIKLCLAEIDAKRPEAKGKLDQMIRDRDLYEIDAIRKFEPINIGGGEEKPLAASRDIVRGWDLRKALLPEKALADSEFIFQLGGKPCRDVLSWFDIEDGSPAWKDNVRGCVNEMQRVHPVAWNTLKELEPDVDTGAIPERKNIFAAFESEAEAATGRRPALGEPGEVNPLKRHWPYVKIWFIALLGFAALVLAFILGRRSTSKAKKVMRKGETPNPGPQADT